ncbi:hypothetical protein BDB00DRAFT_958444 [Zychaea mexicana]|uniref:uncharacterized protein n=1 Tax=Zychaea mexicana TaxID=64656 RepID=UPI0022FE35E4|nr:uncharacterized protein BDB00DRAFT_958444 [Zychaea mexicana]KAI9492239.1 hypothetical protein BDB00DRAFT_958444 [Zychaea mexicana]
MQLIHLVLLLALTASCAHAFFLESWSFKNWNDYADDKSDSTAAWREEWSINRWSWPRSGGTSYNNHRIVDDPAGGSEKVLQVTYPVGSSNPAGSPQGGIGFYAQPITLRREARLVSFEYQVYFPDSFTFVKGGKLPGLYGGHEGCSGGSDSESCFSTRFMWRRQGDGEIYAYMPESKQRDTLCDEEGNICNPNYGYSLGRGSWRFQKGEWVKIRQTLKLNHPDRLDGMVHVHVNGRLVYSENQLALVARDTDKIIGVAFHTFFGGSGIDWAPEEEMYTYFKDFTIAAFY